MKTEKKDPGFPAKKDAVDGDDTVDGDDKEKDVKKSMDLNPDDLEKSLDKLAAIATEGDVTTRKTELLQKAMETDLEKSEQEELFGLMGAPVVPEKTHAETIVKGFGENETLQKAYDVSDYLREHQEEIVKSLGQMAEYQEKGETRQHEFNMILAKSVSDTGKLIKAMSERLGVLSTQPARGPKSAGLQPMEKSFAGSAPAGDTLSKSVILDSMEAMHTDAIEKSGSGVVAGEDMLNAIAKYENTNSLSKSMLAEVTAYRNRTIAAH